MAKQIPVGADRETRRLEMENSMKNVFRIIVAVSIILTCSQAHALSEEAKRLLDGMKKKPVASSTVIVVPEKSMDIDFVFDHAASNQDQDVEKSEKILEVYPDLVHSRVNSGKTPLHMAALTGSRKMAALFLRFKANVNATDNDGKTPLDICSDQDFAKFLITNGGKKSKVEKQEKARVAKSPKPSASSTGYSSSGSSHLSPGDYTTHVGPRGGVYHYSASGKKVYHSSRRRR